MSVERLIRRHAAACLGALLLCAGTAAVSAQNAPTPATAPAAAPLIVSLHGMGAAPTVMCNTTAIDLAEQGGYVLVAPMGYSTTGWFGSPVINMGAGRGPRGPGPGALLITGDADEVVPPSNTRMWADTLKELQMDHVYIEQPGVTHGPVITTSQKEIFDFFGKHTKK